MRYLIADDSRSKLHIAGDDGVSLCKRVKAGAVTRHNGQAVTWHYLSDSVSKTLQALMTHDASVCASCRQRQARVAGYRQSHKLQEVKR